MYRFPSCFEKETVKAHFLLTPYLHSTVFVLPEKALRTVTFDPERADFCSCVEHVEHDGDETQCFPLFT